MTVTSETARAQYTGDGSTTDFPITFDYSAQAEIDVYLTLISDDTAETLQTLGADYTIDSSDNVVMGTAPSNLYKLCIIRDVPLTQLQDLVNQGGRFPATDETTFDKLCEMVQMLWEKMNRCVVGSVNWTVDPASITIADLLAAAISDDVTVDSSGNIVMLNDTGIKIATAAGALQEILKLNTADIIELYNGVVLLDSSGKVGLGVTPQRLLHLHSLSSGTHLAMTDAAGGATASDGYLTSYEAGNITHMLYENGYQKWHTGGTERMRMLATGEIMVNAITQYASEQFGVNGGVHVNGDTTLDGTLDVTGDVDFTAGDLIVSLGTIHGKRRVTPITNTYLALITDDIIHVTGSATFNLNLYSTLGHGGRHLTIKNGGTGTVTVRPDGIQTIDGGASIVLTALMCAEIYITGSNWSIINVY